MKTNVKMSVKLEHMKKPSHAVSTCSPDCPTDSAVERALVDLEWRREAAGKRNGNTHRINTEVPKTQNATVQRTATNRPCFLMKRNGAGYEWIASANPQTPWQPAGSHTAFKTHRHNKGTLLCKVFLMHQLIQTPHWYSRHEVSIGHYVNMQYKEHQESQSTIWIPE